ncbi:MAG: CoA pyrophosphatase [Mariniblastus sp.]
MLTKQHLRNAMALSGFENWRPSVDVPHLDRPTARPKNTPGIGRIAAVMILIYIDSEQHQEPEELKLVLTKRNANLSKHANQISFPGGRQDAGETLEQTAVRETEEEIGVRGAEIQILGPLNSVYIPPSDFTVTPFVGWKSEVPDFVPSPDEVAEVIEVSVAHLMEATTLKCGDIETAKGKKLDVPYYEVGQHQVWGATAIILGELIERLNRVVIDT